jgi:hypothetical protein
LVDDEAEEGLDEGAAKEGLDAIPLYGMVEPKE